MKYAVAADIGGTNFRLGLVSSYGRILNIYKARTPSSSKELLSLIMLYVEGVQKKISGIGVAIASPLDPRTGKVDWSQRIGFPKSFNLKKELGRKVKVPVFVENDMNAATLAEASFGGLKRVKNGVVVTISTGIGGGILIDGKLYEGNSFIAGEIGHVPVEVESNMKCNFGHRGDWEALASALSVENRYKVKTGIKKTAEEVVALAKKGDKTSTVVIKETAKYIGIGLSGVVNILDPEVVVICGSFFLEIWPILKNDIKKELLSYSMNEKVKIVTTKLGDTGGLLGAASLVFNS